MKVCSSPECKQINPQPEERFPLEKKDGYTWRRAECKKCRSAKGKARRDLKKEEYNAYMREWREEHKDSKKYKDRNRNRSLKKNYGVTLAQYESMLSAQSGRCYLCPKTFSGKSKKLGIDHCHVTGKIRGLLCDGCNRTIAILDNPELFAKALHYLKR